jgi:hypothetical protein
MQYAMKRLANAAKPRKRHKYEQHGIKREQGKFEGY